MITAVVHFYIVLKMDNGHYSVGIYYMIQNLKKIAYY